MVPSPSPVTKPTGRDPCHAHRVTAVWRVVRGPATSASYRGRGRTDPQSPRRSRSERPDAPAGPSGPSRASGAASARARLLDPAVRGPRAAAAPGGRAGRVVDGPRPGRRRTGRPLTDGRAGGADPHAHLAGRRRGLRPVPARARGRARRRVVRRRRRADLRDLVDELRVRAVPGRGGGRRSRGRRDVRRRPGVVEPRLRPRGRRRAHAAARGRAVGRHAARVAPRALGCRVPRRPARTRRRHVLGDGVGRGATSPAAVFGLG